MKPKTVPNLTRTLTALLLALMLAFSQMAPMYAAADQTAVHTAAEAASLTRLQARDIIFAAASNYRDGLKLTNIMSGYADGSLKEAQAVTRLETLVMLSRAFGELPEPGNAWILDAADGTYSDVPAWAEPELAKLYAAKIFAPAIDGALSDKITAKQLDTLIRRFYSLFGMRLEDDFYAYVNKEWLTSSEIPEGRDYLDTFTSLDVECQVLVDAMVSEIVSGTWEKGSAERMIADVYKAALDQASRDKIGAKPFEAMLKRLSEVKTLKNFEKSLTALAADFAVYPIFSTQIGQDYNDSTKAVIQISGPSYRYRRYDESAALARAIRLFELAGVSKPAETAAAAIAIDALLAKAYADSPNDPSITNDKEYKKFTADQVQEWIPGADMSVLLTLGGFKAEPTYWAHYADGEFKLKEIGKFYTESNAAALAAFAQFKLLDAYKDYMSADFASAGETAAPAPVSEKEARDYVREVFHDYFSDAFGKKYFSAQARADITKMIQAFVENYKVRLENNTWLTTTTKATALKKLSSMKIMIGYPEKMFDFTSGLKFNGIDKGGSLLEIAIAVETHKKALELADQGKPYDKSRWEWDSYRGNAAYVPQKGALFFPAGILRAPFYDVNAKPEENYAAIGVCIAHEITHAFDVAGSHFDENSNVADWWTDKDIAAFAKLNAAVVTHYDGVELVPGIFANGRRTLAENTADLGGISCGLEALKKEAANPDYKLFFTKYAKIYRSIMDRDFIDLIVSSDPHSYGVARVNQAVQNFQEFYDAFGVKPGDGMYVAPEDRVKVW